MKKFASLVGAGAMLLTLAGSAFAYDWFDGTFVKNYARVRNEVTVKADTGDNSVHGFKVFGGEITTGDALAAGGVTNVVNSNSLDCGCFSEDGLFIKNKAKVSNDLYVKADTGDNEIHGFKVFGGSIVTGGALAEGLVTNVVNTTTTGGDLELE